MIPVMTLSPILTKPDQLPAHLCSSPSTIAPVVASFPMRIPGYLADLMQSADSGLARQFIPDPQELLDIDADADPLSEEKQSPAPLIVHRYPHRVIFLVSSQCAAYCRFCMRKRRVSGRQTASAQAIQAGLNYIDHCTAINEVVLSGGDPFMLRDHTLVAILATLKQMAHVRILRIHTRVPMAWPQRVTAELAHQLATFQPIYINIHCNHPKEITAASATACRLLADAGIALGSQSVLLKGVNDDPLILGQLMEKLLSIRVRPYYLHQIDRVPGTAHFSVPIEKSLELVAGLRGRISGLAIPHFMIDLPGGGGKIALLPETIEKKHNDHWTIRNFQHQLFAYPID
jgi:lysine 2,3-aminomutase